jgi:hypothetical protein
MRYPESEIAPDSREFEEVFGRASFMPNNSKSDRKKHFHFLCPTSRQRHTGAVKPS